MSSDLNNQDLKQFVTDVERDLLFHILTNMKHRKITVGEAQDLAKDFLAVLPVHDKMQLLDALNDLAKDHPEARAVYAKYAPPVYEKQRDEKLAKMAEYIKNGDIEKALEVAKGTDTKTQQGEQN